MDGFIDTLIIERYNVVNRRRTCVHAWYRESVAGGNTPAKWA